MTRAWAGLSAGLMMAAALAACSGGSPDAGASLAPTDSASTPADAPSALPPAPPAKAKSVSTDNEYYSFEYAYPAAAAAISGLAEWLDADLAKRRNTISKDARESKVDADKEGYTFNKYSLATAWSVVADLPGWLSLKADVDTYTGGAHGMNWSETVLWDKGAAKARMPVDLFISKAALSAAIRSPFCDALDRERSKRREERVTRDSGMFSECIDPVDSTIIVGSSNKAQFDRIGVLIAPYEAGPYAEGAYEVTVPVTAAVLKAVKPEYRAAFALGR